MQSEIVEIYRGFPIRKYNIIELRIDISLYEKIFPFTKRGISLREIIEKTSAPCDYCKGELAMGFDDNNNSIKIKRGILCKSK